MTLSSAPWSNTTSHSSLQRLRSWSTLAHTYFKGDDLAEVRVRRSSRACAALIRWYGDAMARVEGALELLTVTAQLAVLKPPSEEPLDRRRLCESIRGERPCDIAAKRLLWFCGADPLTWRR